MLEDAARTWMDATDVDARRVRPAGLGTITPLDDGRRLLYEPALSRLDTTLREAADSKHHDELVDACVHLAGVSVPWSRIVRHFTAMVEADDAKNAPPATLLRAALAAVIAAPRPDHEELGVELHRVLRDLLSTHSLTQVPRAAARCAAGLLLELPAARDAEVRARCVAALAADDTKSGAAGGMGPLVALELAARVQEARPLAWPALLDALPPLLAAGSAARRTAAASLVEAELTRLAKKTPPV